MLFLLGRNVLWRDQFTGVYRITVEGKFRFWIDRSKWRSRVRFRRSNAEVAAFGPGARTDSVKSAVPKQPN